MTLFLIMIIPMKIGYARCSTTGQNLDSQLDALKAAGCEKIFQDIASGSKTERKGLQAAIDFCREGDVLTIWRLDRAGRSLTHLIEIVNTLKQRNIGFHSISQDINTGTPTGMLVFHIFSSLAEYEREQILERTAIGLKSARARGRIGGRPRVLDKKTTGVALELYKGKKTSIGQICDTLKISKSTLYRTIRTHQQMAA